jgi:DNA (cytosine-5)-methyltransferase 1
MELNTIYNEVRYFSMFSGIGGFELGIQNATTKIAGLENSPQTESMAQDSTDNQSRHGRQLPTCIGYSEIDKYAIKVYERQFNGNTDDGATGGRQRQQEFQPDTAQPNITGKRTEQSTSFNTSRGHRNYGDATAINAAELPDFDLLVGGFPCQAFSIAGKRAGFNDTRGTLFFDIARILAEKRPRHLVLENVKGLLSHDYGKTFQTILGVLSDLGYRVEWQVLNSKNFGVPQNRERVYIVGHLGNECGRKVFPITRGSTANIKYDVKGSQRFRVYNPDGLAPTIPTMQGGYTNTITSVTKDNLVGIDLSMQEPKLTQNARALQARYNKGYSNRKAETTGVKEGARIRRLTPLECERLQGFPDNWTVGESDTQRYKMCGNAVTVNVVEAVMKGLMKCL